MPHTPLPYPVNLCIDGQPVLVVGGGPIAARKVEGLRRAGACVTVVAPAAVDAIAENPEVVWRRRAYRPDESRFYRLVVTATSDPAVNALVARDCEAAGVFVNSADDPANCTFTLPSVARRGDLQVAVSTGGRSPALARWLRKRIEQEIDSGCTTLLELLAETRQEAKAAFETSEVPGWEAALDRGLLELVRLGRTVEARSLLRRHLGLGAPEPADTKAGIVTAHPRPPTPSHQHHDHAPPAHRHQDTNTMTMHPPPPDTKPPAP